MPIAQRLLQVAFRAADVPDRDLLARFVASTGAKGTPRPQEAEEAFAELVRRNGPMVLAVCRRVTGCAQDAEDAFQATFLVLARRAAHVTRPELLANWLYGVAYRTALDARASRRRVEERTVSTAPEPAAPVPTDTADLREVIDEELTKLAEKYRAAVVLCELEGLSRASAAVQLGIPEGTLSSRLAHARKLLAERLKRRGVTAPAAALGTLLGKDALAVLPPLTHTTSLAAVRACTGLVPAVSPAVSSLTDGVLKTMLANRLRQAFGIGLLACGLIGVGGALAQQLRPTLPPGEGPPAVAPGTDPFAAQPAQKSEPKKVAAKGIEDDDVPYGTFPSQAVARVEDGKLVVRLRVQFTEPVQATTWGDARTPARTVTHYQIKSAVTAATYDPADVAVFDMKGSRLALKVWKEMLKGDVHALVSSDGKLPNPRELALFKADTLLIVLPAPSIPAQHGVWTGGALPSAPALVPSVNTVPAPSARPAQSLVPPSGDEMIRPTMLKPTDNVSPAPLSVSP